MRFRGRPVLGAVAGFFLGLFLVVDLIFFTVIGSGSPLIAVFPIVFLILGLALALVGPLGRGRIAREAVVDDTQAEGSTTTA
jgi:hypothetical protein